MTVPEELVLAAEARLSQHWQERIVARITEQMQRELREGLPPALPDSERAAISMLKDIANRLRRAAEALAHAAQDLNHAGLGVPANRTHKAAMAARKDADDILGSSV